MSIYSSLEDRYYALMEFLEQKLHIPVYKWLVTPIERVGVPSFPVVAAAFLLVVAGIAWSVAGVFAGAAPTQLTVVALAAGQPVPGAEVLLKWTTGSVLQTTNEKGGALFKDLPSGRSATIAVSKTGFKNATSRVTLGTVTNKLVSLEAQRVNVVLTLQDNNGALVPNAFVDWSIEGGGPSGSVQSDDQGVARFSALPLQLVSVTISKEGYDTATLFIERPAADYGQTVTLTKHSVIRFEAPRENGTVRVNVRDESGAIVSNVSVGLYARNTNALISTAEAWLGSVDFADVPRTSVYVTVDARGFAVKSGAGRNASKQVFGLTTFDVVLKALGAAEEGDSVIHVVNDANENVAQASVLLFASVGLLGSGQVAEFSFANKTSSDSNGDALFGNLPTFYYFYASASKEGHFPSVTLPFLGGESKNITLERAQTGTSTELVVTVRDYASGGVVQNASVSVYDDQGAVLYHDKRTDAQGKASFKPLRRNSTVRVSASKDDLTGEATANLTTATKNVVLYVDVPFGSVQAVAVDGAGAAVTGVLMNATQNGETVSFCNTGASNSCSLKIHADIPATIDASKSGMVPGQSSVTVTSAGSATVNVMLLGSDGVCCNDPASCGFDQALLDSPVKNVCARQDAPRVFENYYNSFRKEVTEVEAGGEYVAELKLNTLNAKASTLFLQTGGALNAQNSALLITAIDLTNVKVPVIEARFGTSPTSAASCKSASLQKPKAEVVPLNAKWVEVEFDTANAPAAITMPVKVLVQPANVQTATALSLDYNGAAQSGNHYRRVPFDSTLKTAPGCSTSMRSLQLKLSGTVSCAAPDFCIKFVFEQGATKTNATSFTVRETSGNACGGYGYFTYTLYRKKQLNYNTAQITAAPTVKFDQVNGQQATQSSNVLLSVNPDAAKQEFTVRASFSPSSLQVSQPLVYASKEQDLRTYSIQSAQACPGPGCACPYVYYKDGAIAANQSRLDVVLRQEPGTSGAVLGTSASSCLYLTGCEQGSFLYRFEGEQAGCFNYDSSQQKVVFSHTGCTVGASGIGSKLAEALMVTACSKSPDKTANVTVTAWLEQISQASPASGSFRQKCRPFGQYCDSGLACASPNGKICQNLACGVSDCALAGTCLQPGHRRVCTYKSTVLVLQCVSPETPLADCPIAAPIGIGSEDCGFDPIQELRRSWETLPTTPQPATPWLTSQYTTTPMPTPGALKSP